MGIDGSAVVVNANAFKGNNVYRSADSSNKLTSFTNANQDDSKKVSSSFTDARGSRIQRVSNYADPTVKPKSWKLITLGNLPDFPAVASYINIPVKYDPALFNVNFAEASGHCYEFMHNA